MPRLLILIPWLAGWSALACVSPELRAEEKLLIAKGDKNRVPASLVELVDPSTLATLGRNLNAAPFMLRDVVITRDRRHALLVHEVPPLTTAFPSVIVVDVTNQSLPVVAQLGHNSVAKRIALTPDGRQAVVAGFANQWPLVPELLFLDVKGAVPTPLKSWAIPGAMSAFGIALSAGGTHAYVVDNHASQVVVVDIMQSPPAVAKVLPLPSPRSVSISPDGRRLLVPYQDSKAAVWDLAKPAAPARLQDLVLPGYFILDPPYFEPGSSFVVAETYMGNYPSAGMVYTVDVRGAAPTVIGSVGVGSQSQSTTGNLIVSSDGLTGWRAMNPTSVLEEIDLTSPTAPKTARTLLHQFRIWTMASFGEVFTPGPTPVGAPFPVFFVSPPDAGRSYLMAASFATRPGIPVGQRTIPLRADALFTLSRTLPSMFTNFTGVLDPRGQAVATIRTPNAPALKGVSFYVAGVVLDPPSPFGIVRISNAVHTVLQ